jgi:hypothetical protein
MIYFGSYIFISFTPIQDYLLEKENKLLYPLKCFVCLYTWSSLLFLILRIYFIGYFTEEMFIWLITVYITLKFDKK